MKFQEFQDLGQKCHVSQTSHAGGGGRPDNNNNEEDFYSTNLLQKVGAQKALQ